MLVRDPVQLELIA